MFLFLKKVIYILLSSLKRMYHIYKLSKKNKTCIIDFSCQIDSCEFEKYVVIFEKNKLYAAKIGAYSYIQTGGRIFNCEIGKFCSIASNVTIGPGIHDMSKVSTHPVFVQKSAPLPRVFALRDCVLNFKKVTIGNDVWIGEKVIILDGATIGNGAVIAAGAVVVKDVEPYSVVAGVPAHHIKYRFDEETIKILEVSRWWDFSNKWFEEYGEIMLDIEKFKEKLRCLQEES